MTETFWHNVAPRFAGSGCSRFKIVTTDRPDPAGPEFHDGTMFFCGTASAAARLAAQEEAASFAVCRLLDLVSKESRHVVLSARLFGGVWDQIAVSYVDGPTPVQISCRADHYCAPQPQRVAKGSPVCMTCLDTPPEPVHCTECGDVCVADAEVVTELEEA
jgi:hypothetical protein